MTIDEILRLKFPQVNFREAVILQDDGQGVYIAKWEDSLGPKPDAAMLAQWKLELAPIKKLQDARQSRRDNYPAIGDQLDMLYKAMDSGELPKVKIF